jgi:AraC-like DNA-binding protein
VKRLSGQTPLEIINQRVLRDAQTMLLHSELNVSEIGFRLEFREKPHFSRFFKNLTGISPVEVGKGRSCSIAGQQAALCLGAGRYD